MYRFGEVDAAEIAFGEHPPLGAQTGEVFIAEVMSDELAI
jgi:hypothetical protein